MDGAQRRAGRPRAVSREMLEEAACELFLERGYEATSVADVTTRAGVSRSTFFNYFQAKSDLLWAKFDDGVARLRADLAGSGTGVEAGAGDSGDPEANARAALRQLARALPPENVALAYSQAGPMGLGDELAVAEAVRLAAVRDVLAPYLRSRGVAPLPAQVRAAALSGALLAAVRAWALAPTPRPPLAELLEVALAAA